MNNCKDSNTQKKIDLEVDTRLEVTIHRFLCYWSPDFGNFGHLYLFTFKPGNPNWLYIYKNHFDDHISVRVLKRFESP